MDHRLRRRLVMAPLLLVLACAGLAVSGAAANAASLRSVLSLAGPAAPPMSGPMVSFGCANPDNHNLLGSVLGAVLSKASNAVTCDGQAIATPQAKGPDVTAGPTGLSPAQIQSAYGLGGLDAAGRTVAVVDAYDDPNAAADLATFRSTYGLPACGAGCFTKVNQSGAATPLPTADAGWSEEISLDLDAVSSACPSCHILLVEANSTGSADLDKAEDAAAATPGVVSISNSYGGAEDATQTQDDPHYDHPGIAITASSGDSGYGVEWPASSPLVTAVGGTELTAATNARGWTETAWSDAGSGCSTIEAKPSWQADTGCAKRTVADVAADADPDSGLGIYDTYNQCGSSSLCDTLIGLGLVQGLDGWSQAGGTSLASPLIASVYALAGNTASLTGASFAYSHAGDLNDVTSGSNGSCGGSYLCTAGTGFDGPTGLGTPNGTGAF